MRTKIFIFIFFIVGIVLVWNSVAKAGGTITPPPQGGTGVSSTVPSNIGQFLQVSSSSPFTYTFASAATGTGANTQIAFWSGTPSSLAGDTDLLWKPIGTNVSSTLVIKGTYTDPNSTGAALQASAIANPSADSGALYVGFSSDVTDNGATHNFNSGLTGFNGSATRNQTGITISSLAGITGNAILDSGLTTQSSGITGLVTPNGSQGGDYAASFRSAPWGTAGANGIFSDTFGLELDPIGKSYGTNNWGVGQIGTANNFFQGNTAFGSSSTPSDLLTLSNGGITWANGAASTTNAYQIIRDNAATNQLFINAPVDTPISISSGGKPYFSITTVGKVLISTTTQIGNVSVANTGLVVGKSGFDGSLSGWTEDLATFGITPLADTNFTFIAKSNSINAGSAKNYSAAVPIVADNNLATYSGSGNATIVVASQNKVSKTNASGSASTTAAITAEVDNFAGKTDSAAAIWIKQFTRNSGTVKNVYGLRIDDPNPGSSATTSVGLGSNATYNYLSGSTVFGASSTPVYTVSVSGTLATDGLSTFSSGFISSASSSFGDGVQVTGALNASSTLLVSGLLTASTFNIGSASVTSTVAAGGLTIGGTNIVVQSATGWVGMGTTNPATALDVEHSDGGSAGTGGQIRIKNTSVSTNSFALLNLMGNNGSVNCSAEVDGLGSDVGLGSTAGMGIKCFSNHPVSFSTNNVLRGRFDTSGNFMVGLNNTTFKSGKFLVDSSGNTTASGTLYINGLSTLNGFISNASSSVGSGLQVAGAMNASSSILFTGSLFGNQSSSNNLGTFFVDSLGNISTSGTLAVWNHVGFFSNSSPTVQGCGTGATVQGSDTGGFIFPGTGVGNSCHLTYAGVWVGNTTSSPACWWQDNVVTNGHAIISVSSTGMSMQTNGASIGSQITYGCSIH